MTLAKHTISRILIVVPCVVGLPILVHLLIDHVCSFRPPNTREVEDTPRIVDSSLRTFGKSYVRRSAGIIQARLEGNSTQIGWASGKLLREEILETESRLFAQFERYVPKSWARLMLLDWAKIRYSRLDRNLDENTREELASLAQAIQPDPFESFMPAYQRLVYLSGLYDISLSFEGAPLLGCTTFVARGTRGDKGHSWLARNFDFEVDETFDRDKIVYFMLETGNIPYASVAWPGLPGVVSAMNAEGVALVVHGGRAGNFDITGEPVLQTMRYVMGHARSSMQAADILREKKPMVSHIVIVTDPAGEALVVERVPRMVPYVYHLAERAVVTNHFIGPAADDPRNLRVREQTTTLYRQQRGQQLLSRLKRPVTAADLVSLLRERRGINDEHLALGDHRAIGALIAAHGVVFDTSARKLWVGAAPHLLGPFVEFRLAQGLSPDANNVAASDASLPEDQLLTDGNYRAWLESARGKR